MKASEGEGHLYAGIASQSKYVLNLVEAGTKQRLDLRAVPEIRAENETVGSPPLHFPLLRHGITNIFHPRMALAP